MPIPTFTLLIVEDLATDRELYRRALCQDSSCTYHLLEAESVGAGLNLCRTRFSKVEATPTIDAILLDYALPDANGLEFLTALDAQSNGSSPPVVMVTGMDDRAIAVRAMKLGAEDYLVKSDLTPELLRSTMRMAIVHARLRLKLQQCNERLRISTDVMLDCFGIYTAIRDASGEIIDFRFEYLNAAALESNQMTAADMSRGFGEVFPAICEPGLFEEYCRVVETGIALYREETNYRDVLGIQQIDRIYDMQINKLDDGFVATWRDVTVQKQAELSLQAKNQQITTIWEGMTDAYVTLDRDWRLVYTNPAATEVIRQLVDLAPEEFLGKTHWEVFPWSVGTTELEYRRAVTEQIAVHFEVLYEPTGTWFEIHAYPSEIGLGIYFRDINDRKQSEAARTQAERERDRFFDLSIDLLIVANLDGYFVRIDPACEQILGFTSAEIVAQPFIDFVHPDDRVAAAAAAESMRTGNVVVNFENRYRCKDGSYRWILWSAIPDLECKLLYANGHDITDRKIAQLNDGFLDELTQRLRHLHDPEAIQWEAVKSIGEYLNVDRSSWFEFDETRWLARISRDWNRDGADSIVGEYPLDEFLSPAFQAAMFAGKPIAIADVTADPLTAAYSDNYQQVGIRAFTNIPCLDDAGRWVMTLHLNTARNVRIWREDEIQLLQTLVTQLWSFVAEARAVQALRAQEEQTRAAQAIIGQQLGEIESIYQMAPVGLCFVDTDFRYVWIDEQLAQINGLSVAEHIGKTFREVLPEVADSIEPLYRQVMESGEPVIDLEVNVTNRAQPGVERCWLASFYPQTDARGRVVGVNNVVQEISLRKRLEAARLSAEQERDRFFDRSIDLLAIGNFEGYFVRINPAFERLFGFTEAEFLARPFIDFVHPDDLESTLAAAHSLANSQSVVDFENRYLCKDGSYVWVSWSATPYEQSNCWYGVGRDITERKQAQADLEQRNQELASFAYVVSHDLKAPLRAVANLSEWIEEDLAGSLSVANQQQMTLLRSRVYKMEATIDGLLDYARVGISVETIESVSIAELLADVIDAIAPPPTFTISLPPELPILSTRRLPLFQVFANLIGNGIKHHDAEDGSIQLSIAKRATTAVEDRGDCYEFAVSDDGPGIAPEHHDRMFKIFQAVNPQKRSDSTGIGLAIVKKIVEAEGGTIWLESEVGKGTTFYFTWLQR
jgi:PAS domain S-box-containing protein